MPSPFPGMDPYLEAPDLWPDCHVTLVVAMRAQLNAKLPPGYFAAADRYVWLHEPEGEARTRTAAPDVFVATQAGPASRAASPAAGATVTPATTSVVLPAVQREGEKYLKIIESRSRRLVTVIELLSPSNKRPGPDREAYLTKRVDYLSAGVNVVEIDLLRGGERLPLGLSPEQPTQYYVLVARASQWPLGEVWCFGVRDSLPVAPVPLLPGDGDCPLALRECLDRAFAEGRYEHEIDYEQPPAPPLPPADAAWARQLLASPPKG